MIASKWTNFPTSEDPLAKYKFLSFSIERDYDVETTIRQTYGLLDWLGDLGGLYDALKYLIQIVMIPIISQAHQMTILSTLF